MLEDHAAKDRLKDSASPYLRSAAHQPIDWYEWGPQAFEAARAAGKPILLDIGAVWCHWCHVIDRESYENPEIAAMINQLYIPVKVDRDERPDVDARYQSAISAISGQGGWPLTAFLTPDGKPFFGGTYFPPEDAMGRPGFKRILLGVSEAFRNKRADVDNSARALEEAVAKAELHHAARGSLDPGIVDSVIESALRLFDEQHGGFGTAPKFPHASAVDLILERYQSTRDPRLLHVAERTLEGMALGGVYDQIAGGFHRYSVDERWCVPHFEKMSYDNSELLKNYLHGYQVTGRPLFHETAEGIIAWVNEVLSDQERGGFYGSQDADQTLDDDGDYFTWTLAEVRAVLSPEESRAIEIYYDVQPRGEMHHNPEKNVLWVASTIDDLAAKLQLDEAATRILLARAKGKLLAARRERRPVPAIDTTLYVAWNAMFISAYLEAGRVLRRDDCAAFALKTLDRILAEAWDENRWRPAPRRRATPRWIARRPRVFQRRASRRLGIDAATGIPPQSRAPDAHRHRALRRSGSRRLLRPRERRRSDGRPRSSPQADSGFAHARRKFSCRNRSRSSLRLNGRKALSRLGRKNSRGLRGTGSAIWTLRRNLRPRRAASRAPHATNSYHRRNRTIPTPPHSKAPPTKFIASANPCCASRQKESRP